MQPRHAAKKRALKRLATITLTRERRSTLFGVSGDTARIYIATLYPSAGEASIMRRGSGRGRPNLMGGSSSGSGAWRARSKLRRFAVANNLSTFSTLTFASRLTEDDAHQEVRGFLHAFRRDFDGGRFPWAFVPEGDDGPMKRHYHVRHLASRVHS